MFRYRRANLKDVNPIIKVMQNTKYAQYVYPGKSLSELKKIISEAMDSREYLVCVDSISESIVGYFILDSITTHLGDVPKRIKLNKKYAYDAGVGVRSDFRNKGIATKLTKYAFRIAKEKGYLGVYADVGSNNDASILLQEKCGFREIVRYDSEFRPNGIQNVVFEIKF